jgi:hypothetical protein
MSQGILLFAHNNQSVDYVLMAAWCAKRANDYLGCAVSLVTDDSSLATFEKYPKLETYFDKIIVHDNGVTTTQQKRYIEKYLTFYNTDRVNAFDLTPYDETFIMDTDIIIQSSDINKVWKSNSSLLFCKHAVEIFNPKNKILEFEKLSDIDINFYWATQFYFKKNTEAEIFFNTCKHIKNNYDWYSGLHSLSSPKYLRNDHVWSMAIHHQGGINHDTWCESLPWHLHYATDDAGIFSMDHDSTIMYKQDIGPCKVSHKDLHVMNKFDLMHFVETELGVIA